jgi:hypothetical protein
MATVLKGKYLENNSISNAKLIQITAANKVTGSAIQLNVISGALVNVSGLKIAVDNSTIVISNDKLQIGPDLSQFIKNDGSIPMTGNLILGNHRISGVLSGHLSEDAVTYEQLMNAITQISGAGAEAGAGLYKIGFDLNVGAGNGIQVLSDSIAIASNGITNAMISTGTIQFDKLASGAQIILKNGSNGGFTNTISGVTPTIASHLATKGYVDTNFYKKASIDLNYVASSEITNFITSAQIRVVKDPSPKLSGNLNANWKMINKISALGVNTSSPSDVFQVNDSGSDAVVITSTGRFGVGKINPSYKADILESRAAAATGNIVNTAATGWGLIINLPNNISSDGYILDLQSGGFSKARFKPNGDVSLTGNLKVSATISSVGATNKIRFYYNQLADRPAAGTNNGLMAYVQTTDKIYFAGGTTWRRLVESADLINYLTSSQIAETYATLGDLNTFLTSAEIETNYISSSDLKNLNLTDLNNVVCSSAVNGQVLKFNGSQWINSTVSGIDLSNYLTKAQISTNYVSSTDLLAYLTATQISTNYVSSSDLKNLNLTDLNNVVCSTATTGQVLKFNGSQWINSADAGGSGVSALASLTDVQISSLLSGQGLKYNGTSWVNSTDTIITTRLANNAVTSTKIVDAAIVASKISTGNITSSKLASSSVLSSKIGTGAVVTTKIANDAVTSDKLAVGAILSTAIGTNAVVTAKIANAVVTSDKLAANSITSGKIITGAILSTKLATGSVISSKIANDSVTTTKILDDAVTSNKLAAGAVLSAAVGTNAIVNSKISANAITGSKIRLQNDEYLRARNSTDSADINIIKVSGDNTIVPNFGLNELNNVTLSSAINGQILKFNGSQWINSTVSSTGGASALNELSDVIISSAATNQVLKFDGSNWINSTISTGGASNLDGLSDVLISSPASGQVLKFDGSNWINSTVSGGSSVAALSDLTDVVISNAVISKETGEGNILVYNGGSWQNRDNMLFGKVFSFHLPAKPTIVSRALSAMNVPDGWTILTGLSDPLINHRLGTYSNDLLISHNVGTFVYDIKIIEIDTTGPFNTRYANMKDYTGEDEIRNSLSDAGSGADGKPSCVKIMDLKGNLQVANEAIVIVKFL